MADSVPSENKVIESGFKGGALSSFKNATEYAIKVGGRKSNVVQVFDKTAKSSLGNPKWLARVDMPHGNVNYPHINVNKAITGIKDPHIPISANTAKAAGQIGKCLDVVQKASPALMAASLAIDAVQIIKEVKKDRKNYSSRNTVKKVATTVGTCAGSLAGSSAGAAIGTLIFPGIGTLLGALIGGITTAVGANSAIEQGAEAILENLTYDMHQEICSVCQKEFTCRQYETGPKKICPNCEKNQ